jgi:small subunit ribosomal protein S6
MRNYEAVLILSPESELLASGKELARNLFNADGCRVLKEDDMGERELAYDVKKNKKGHYIVYELELEPSHIPNLHKALKLRSEILKYMFVRKDS